MLKILLTIVLVGAFFILFFKPKYNLKNKTVSEPEASTTAGFIEDTEDAFINPRYPTQLIKMDETGSIKPIYGDIGTFVAYSSIPEDNWLHGFPHKKA
tara:strand:+ start:2419 stop:2712 length:294 start_codon:yes stop_codon:yes gene_type:complete